MEDVRWLGICKVHTSKPFSHVSLFKSMRNAWASAHGVTFKPMGENLFLVQFMCVGDWNRVMGGGPWLFRKSAVVIEEYDGFTNVQDYKLDRIPVWARVSGVPDGLMKRKDMAEKIAAKVGKAPLKVIVNEGRINPAKYLRCRVFIELDTPLVRFVPITLKERKKYPVEYEKLPDFCDYCGLVGHVVTECGDGLHKPEECEWGDWLLVNFETADSGGQAGRGRGRDNGPAGRGGGFGRGRNNNPGEPNEQENNDMDLGGSGGLGSNQIVPSARKRLVGPDGTFLKDTAVIPSVGVVAEKVLQIENRPVIPVDKSTMSTPQKVQEAKRQRTFEDGGLVIGGEPVDTNMESATLGTGDRRDQ